MTDAISRSELLKIFDRNSVTDLIVVADKTVKQHVYDAPALDVAPKWVSVKDRLPDAPGEYLASSNEYVITLEYDGGKWHDFSGARYFVDAWTEKPEGYKSHDWDGEENAAD